MEYPWTLQTMQTINDLTPKIKGKALRQRFEQTEERLFAQGIEWDGKQWSFNGKG